MLRRTVTTPKRKRDPWGNPVYKPQSYTLPKPTLVAESKRLARAVLDGGDFYATGPQAAEQYVRHRRKQLGLK